MERSFSLSSLNKHLRNVILSLLFALLACGGLSQHARKPLLIARVYGYRVKRGCCHERLYACVMRYGMRLRCDWRTGNIRFMMKTPRAKRDDWPRCGAHRKRDGQGCRARALANGRCKYHGGLSTGPKTLKGKARALTNLKQFRSG